MNKIENDISDIKVMLKEVLIILEETASSEDQMYIRNRREDRAEEGCPEDLRYIDENN